MTDEIPESEKYPKGHFTGLWIGVGLTIFSGLSIPIIFILGSAEKLRSAYIF